jgi:hypothetical protein
MVIFKNFGNEIGLEAPMGIMVYHHNRGEAASSDARDSL